MELIKPNSLYIVVNYLARQRNGVIGVVDLWNQLNDVGKSQVSKITDAPQYLVHDLLKRGYPVNDKPLIYLDERDIWDCVKVHNGNFDGFHVLHAPNFNVALDRLIADGILSRADSRKA